MAEEPVSACHKDLNNTNGGKKIDTSSNPIALGSHPTEPKRTSTNLAVAKEFLMYIEKRSFLIEQAQPRQKLLFPNVKRSTR